MDNVLSLPFFCRFVYITVWARRLTDRYCLAITDIGHRWKSARDYDPTRMNSGASPTMHGQKLQSSLTIISQRQIQHHASSSHKSRMMHHQLRTARIPIAKPTHRNCIPIHSFSKQNANHPSNDTLIISGMVVHYAISGPAINTKH